MKYLVIGADGQLGHDLCRVIPKPELVALTIKEIDVTDRAGTLRVLQQHRPEVVINTAAYTAVDAAETAQELARKVNEIGARNVAAACLAIKAALVQLSTDYVFRGDKPKGSAYTEDDEPDPRSFYGKTKLAGEEAVRKILPEHYIVRSAGLYGLAGCLGKGGGNFVETIIKKAAQNLAPLIVNDEYVTPTYTYDLAEKIYQLVQTRQYGVYHLVNQGQCSWYEFGARVLELIGSGVKPEQISREKFGTGAQRPANSALASVRLKAIGLSELRPWPEALRAYLSEKGYNISRGEGAKR
jgi:dTDP-4-dehydrorhamnose reductase